MIMLLIQKNLRNIWVGKKQLCFNTLQQTQTFSSQKNDHKKDDEAISSIWRKIVMNRSTCKDFDPEKPIAENVLRDILLYTQRAPTGFNTQPYGCIIVRNKEKREQMSDAMLASNKRKIKRAPLIAVFVSDTEPMKRIPLIQKMMHEAGAASNDVTDLPNRVRLFAGEGSLAGVVRCAISNVVSPIQAVPSFVPTIAWSYKQTIFAASTFLYSATSHGLATCIMEGFDERRLKSILNVPERYSIPVAIAVGYPGKDYIQKGKSPRLPTKDLFFEETFGSSFEHLFTTSTEVAKEKK